MLRVIRLKKQNKNRIKFIYMRLDSCFKMMKIYFVSILGVWRGQKGDYMVYLRSNKVNRRKNRNVRVGNQMGQLLPQIRHLQVGHFYTFTLTANGPFRDYYINVSHPCIGIFFIYIVLLEFTESLARYAPDYDSQISHSDVEWMSRTFFGVI